MGTYSTSARIFPSSEPSFLLIYMLNPISNIPSCLVLRFCQPHSAIVAASTMQEFAGFSDTLDDDSSLLATTAEELSPISNVMGDVVLPVRRS